MYVDWKKQMVLRRCNFNLYHMVNLEAIPWETKTATLLHEENFDPRNFPKKVSKTKDTCDVEGEDSDDALPSDDDPSPTKDANGRSSGKRSKGRAQGKKSRPQTKEKAHPDTLGRWACHCCFKILPAQYFEGKCLEENTSRLAKDHKRLVKNSELDKKSDMRVEYVRVIAVDPARVPEWLTKDKLEMKTTGDIETYVRQRMERGVDCDDLRWYYKGINTRTHRIAPVRGVTPVFTASTMATPPGCETYRPFYKIAGTNTSRGMDNDTYTYEICIPEDSTRDEDPMVLPHSKPVGRISQPQKRAYDQFRDIMGPAPEVGDIIALRRFCILCGAKNGAYRRDCNRKIISKTNEGWWVCDCRQVRQAGRGKNCPSCGRKVIY